MVSSASVHVCCSCLPGSTAGLLMTSQASSVDESVFFETSLRRNVSPSSATGDGVRRHKKSLSQSAAVDEKRRHSDRLPLRVASMRHSDAVNRRASDGVTSDKQQSRNAVAVDSAVVIADARAAGDNEALNADAAQTGSAMLTDEAGDNVVQTGEMDNLTDKAKHSTAIFKGNNTDVLSTNTAESIDKSADSAGNSHVLSGSSQKDADVTDTGLDNSSVAAVAKDVFSENSLHSKDSSTKTASGDVIVAAHCARVGGVMSKSKSLIASPAHRTPVTENDPLGMFSSAASSDVTSSAAAQETPDIVVSSNASLASSSSGSSDRDVLRAPFSGGGGVTSTPVRSLFGGETKPQRGNSLGSASAASSELGSPIRDWQPLSSSADVLDRRAERGSDDSTSSGGAHGSRVAASARGGVARSESFMKSMRSVAGGWLSTKITQIKETATGGGTPSKESVHTGTWTTAPAPLAAATHG